jgi:hypothetical protein
MRRNYKLTELGPVFQMDALNHQAEADYQLADQVVWVLIGLFAACILLLTFWPELEGMF